MVKLRDAIFCRHIILSDLLLHKCSCFKRRWRTIYTSDFVKNPNCVEFLNNLCLCSSLNVNNEMLSYKIKVWIYAKNIYCIKVSLYKLHTIPCTMIYGITHSKLSYHTLLLVIKIFLSNFTVIKYIIIL